MFSRIFRRIFGSGLVADILEVSKLAVLDELKAEGKSDAELVLARASLDLLEQKVLDKL